jgi:glycosyltransferase involved in cell wall biosynthesis
MCSTSQISVIIPTYNKAERIKFLLESLKKQSGDVEFDVIVVDDGSKDATKFEVFKYFGDLNLQYFYKPNKGRSHARNFGLSKVKTSYVIFCDDDLILANDFVFQHYKMLRDNPECLVHGKIWTLPYLAFFLDPENGTVYDEVRDQVPVDSFLHNFLIDFNCIYDIKRLDKQKKMTSFERNLVDIVGLKERKLEFLLCTGGNFSCNTKTLLEVGGFDEKLDEKWGVEDLELGYRLSKKNIGFMYNEKACNYHITHYRKAFKDDLNYSLKLFYEKHKDPIILKLDELLLKRVNDFTELIQ